MRSMLAMAALAIVFAAPMQSGPAREGIVVHGDWTIEVRNPDGRIVTHRQFKNGLTGGAGFIKSLLLGSAVPGGWGISLGLPGAEYPCRTPTGGHVPCVMVESSNANASSEMSNASKTLSVTSSGDVIVLGGTATAGFDSAISAASTFVFACAPTMTVQSCKADANTGTIGFTRAAISPAVNVVNGQIIQTTVRISFTSPPPPPLPFIGLLH